MYDVAVSLDSAPGVGKLGDKTVKIWDSVTGKELLALKGHAGPVVGVAFWPGRPALAIGGLGPDGEDLGQRDGQGAVRSQGPCRWGCWVALARTASALASASWDQTVKLWDDRQSCSPSRAMQVLSRPWRSARTASALASGGDDQTVKIWDSATGKEFFALKAAPMRS